MNIGPIDVAIITKNSMKPCLNEMMHSLVREVPINKLIVIDGYSKDGTIEYIEKFCKRFDIPLVLDYDDGNRATAREKAIRYVDTDIFAFIDTDVILLRDWFSKMIRWMDDDVGMVWGLALIDKEFNRVEWDIYRASLWLRRLDEKEGVRHEGYRGYTHDVLIRKDAVKGIHIPSELHVLEDYFIMRYVIERGYKYVVADDAFVLHKFKSSLREQRLFGRLGLKYGAFNYKGVINRFISMFIMPIAISIFTGNLYASYYKLLKDFNFLIGLLFSGT